MWFLSARLTACLPESLLLINTLLPWLGDSACLSEVCVNHVSSSYSCLGSGIPSEYWQLSAKARFLARAHHQRNPINKFVESSFSFKILDIIETLETKKLCKQILTINILVFGFQRKMSNSSHNSRCLAQWYKDDIDYGTYENDAKSKGFGVRLLFFLIKYTYIRACITYILSLKNKEILSFYV